jgi:hypothetical protein
VKRFAVHDKIINRKLLWHGTNVAVVAAILEGGLRIMPHSRGRVGRGIYFASENGKSAGYGEYSTYTNMIIVPLFENAFLVGLLKAYGTQILLDFSNSCNRNNFC